ncbi:MAG: DEAD/DEAH box helicase, partial [Litorimonas sp.]
GFAGGPQPAFQMEIKGLKEPTTEKGRQACEDDINDIIASFVQDRRTVEKGLFTEKEELVPEELTVVRMGKVIRDRYPDLPEDDREALRQRAVAALNITQKGSEEARKMAAGSTEPTANIALLEGVRQFAMNVRDLDIDLIDAINPFGEAYSILGKAMDEERLKAIAAIIAGKKVTLDIEEARDLAKRAVTFKAERGRLPSATSQDPWERRMAEGIIFLRRKATEAKQG